MLDNELSKSILSRFSNENLWEFMRVDCRRGQVTQQKQFRIWEICTWWLFSHSVVSDSLWPHELQHARPPCPSPTPRVHSDSGPLSRWCHPAISSSVVPFSSCPQSLPESESFPMSWLFSSGGQSIGASVSVSVLPTNIQGWFPLGLPVLISDLF